MAAAGARAQAPGITWRWSRLCCSTWQAANAGSSALLVRPWLRQCVVPRLSVLRLTAHMHQHVVRRCTGRTPLLTRHVPCAHSEQNGYHDCASRPGRAARPCASLRHAVTFGFNVPVHVLCGPAHIDSAALPAFGTQKARMTSGVWSSNHLHHSAK